MIPVLAGGRLGSVLELVGLSLTQAVLAVVGAFCVQQVFDRLLVADAPPAAYAIGIAALFATSVLAIAALDMRRVITAERLSLDYIAVLRAAMFDRIMQAAPSTIHRRREGGLLLPFVGDLTAIKKWVGDGLARAISASVTLLLLLAALCWLNPPLAIGAAAVVLAAFTCALILSAPLARAIRRVRRRRGALANFVSSSARAAATVQAFNRLHRERGRLERRTQALGQAGVRLARLSGAMSALAIVAGGALVALTLTLGVMAPAGSGLSAGVLAGAISLVGLASVAIRDLGVALELAKRAQASFVKVEAALSIAPAVRAGRRAVNPQAGGGALSLDDVTIAGVLKAVTLSAQPGEVVNIEGPSGSGKSALAALIVRLRDPDRGTVTLDGIDIRRMSARALRQRVGFAGAAAPLMRGTVMMNLKYRSPRASSDELSQVIELCGIRELISRLPAGEQSRVSEGAPELSRGDQQRLMIARAMLGSPLLLVLDEVDSHLDPETAARIAGAFASYAGLIVMVSTSPAWRRAATSVWSVAHQGAIARPALSGVEGVITTPLKSAS